MKKKEEEKRRKNLDNSLSLMFIPGGMDYMEPTKRGEITNYNLALMRKRKERKEGSE